MPLTEGLLEDLTQLDAEDTDLVSVPRALLLAIRADLFLAHNRVEDPELRALLHADRQRLLQFAPH